MGSLRFDVLTVVNIDIVVLWDVMYMTPWNLLDMYLQFEGTWWLHLHNLPEVGDNSVKIKPEGCAENICLQICHFCQLLKKKKIFGGHSSMIWKNFMGPSSCSLWRLKEEALGSSKMLVPISTNWQSTIPSNTFILKVHVSKQWTVVEYFLYYTVVQFLVNKRDVILMK